MQDLRNLFFFIIISLLILTGWDLYFGVSQEQKVQEQTVQAQNKRINALAKNDEGVSDVVPQTEWNEEKEIKIIPGRYTYLSEEVDVQRVKIETEKLSGSINLRGANFDDLILKAYREHLDPISPKVALLSPQGSKEVNFARFGWINKDKNIKVPDANSVWQADKDSISAGESVHLTWDNVTGQRFIINITIDDNYMFGIQQKVENNSDASITLYPYGFVNKALHVSEDAQSNYILHEGPLGVFNEKLEEVTYDDLADDKIVRYEDSTGWFGMTDKYWLSAIIPSKGEVFDTKFSYKYSKGQHRYQADFISAGVEITAGSTHNTNNHFMAGAKEVALLDKYAEEYGIILFDRAVDFGLLYFLTKPIFNGLHFFYGILGNFGLAIIMLTVCIKILLFPFANKSYKAFAQMKKLSPRMKEIREAHGDDKSQMNQAIMAMYKEEKVNPMSGCLPILLQLPIFFALYKVLYVTIEMRHAPFYGWITDLSAPDPTSILNLFGLMPWSEMMYIGVLPILMMITMIMQQSLNPPPADPVQAKVMKALPFVFLFLFAGFPAGLVLYWVCNNTLSIMQQWVITRKINKEG